MSVVYIVLPLALLVVGVAVAAFLWAAKRGQFDDLDTPAMRALHEDAPAPTTNPTTAPIAKEEDDRP
jgi:cbb3-type cytochrome oxidase maturation protein